MVEVLTNAYLEQVAQTIDDACDSCHKAETIEDGNGQRSLIHAMLTTLGTQWDREGAEGSKFTDALKEKCMSCVASKRETAVLANQFTCGIRQRIPETINKQRPNITSR
jgi:hypothetical protein